MNVLGRIALAVVLLGVVFVVKDGRVPGFIEQLLGKGSPIAALGGAPVVSSENDAMSDKLQPFIACINRVDTRLHEHFDEYETAWPARDKMESTGLVFGFKTEVYETNNSFSKECADGLDKAVAQSPADPTLDAAGKTYAATLREAIPVMNAIDAYYDQEDFRDDNMAKGRELDAQLRPLIATLFTASDEIRAAVAQHDLQLTQEQLDAMEAQGGKDYNWYELNLMHQARIAVDAIKAAANSEDTLTVAAITSAEQTYNAAIEAGETYAAANPGVKTELGNQPKWFSIVRYANTFLTAIKTLRRDIDEGKTDEISHDLDQTLDGYNGLVDDYNLRVSNGG